MSFTPIRERDQSGKLVRSGYQWLERRDATFVPLLFGFLLPIPGVLYGLFLILIDKQLGFPILLGSALILWLCGRGMRRNTSLPRSLVFGLDGSIDTPQGLPAYANLRRWEMTHADVVSIEANMYRNNSTVELFKRSGGKEVLAQKLTVDEARQVAVQLNLALAEMRVAKGGAIRIGDAEVVID